MSHLLGPGGWRAATPAQRATYEIIGDGLGVHWPDVDEDVSAEGMLKTEANRMNYRLAAFCFLAEIDRMQLEVREYLSLYRKGARLSGQSGGCPWASR